MNMEDVFNRGLHRLSAHQLIELADSQQFLLSEVSTRDLVYLVQELAFRLSDTLEGMASSVMLETSADVPTETTLATHEYNG